MQPVAPPSPDYIPGLEDPQTPPVPQDEDEPEEQSLPPVDSPTAESPGYVTESDPEEDPEEYEDDETEDGPVYYPMDRGDDGDDDDGDSSRDDVDNEDEDEEEEEHLAPVDSTVVVPIDEPVSPPEGTEPVIPPAHYITIGARITVLPQASISLPPDAEVDRFWPMTTYHHPTTISLSPPSAGKRLCYGVHGPNLHIHATRDLIAPQQALIDAVTANSINIPPPQLPLPYHLPYSTNQPVITVGMIFPSPSSHLARGLVSLLEDSQDSRYRNSPASRYGLAAATYLWGKATHHELQTHRDHVYAYETHLQAHQTQLQLHGTLIQTQHQGARHEMEEDPLPSDDRHEAIDWQQCRPKKQCELLALQEQRRRARQPTPDARIPDHQDSSGDADSHDYSLMLLSWLVSL
ncbi:hypothetical protein Tco_0626809 [Tanacetum coccineum]|uniref:Uncharacterized protein n=1 Tax=Tanacetum coccineum TaxID=301880 RepID=A0ABQ4WKK9_9ASTR